MGCARGGVVQASREVTGGTRLLWVTKALTIALILIVAAITSVKLIAGDSHGGLHFDMSVFTVARAIDSSSLFLGVVFGFLSFVGFEAAATLGEENPRGTSRERSLAPPSSAGCSSLS